LVQGSISHSPTLQGSAVLPGGVEEWRYTFKSDIPWKINGRFTYSHHPFRKENDRNQTSMIMFQPLIFRGVTEHPVDPILNSL